MRIFPPIYQKYWAEEVLEGGVQVATSLHDASTPRPRHEGLWAPCRPTCPPLLLYEGFRPGKNRGGAFSWFRRRHEAELEHNQSRAPAGRSCCRTSLPEGEIVAIVITNTPLIGWDLSPSTSSSAPSHLQTLVHHL